jgi:hypothetical protein
MPISKNYLNQKSIFLLNYSTRLDETDMGTSVHHHPSVNGIDCYVIRKLLHSVFAILPVFICQNEIQTYMHWPSQKPTLASRTRRGVISKGW